MEPLAPKSLFERRLESKGKADLDLLARMKYYRDGAPIEALRKIYRQEHESSDPITITFSSKQLALLRTRVGGDQLNVSTNDALVAYVIFRLNTHFFPEQQPIQRASMVVNYRGISTTLCSPNQVGNYFMHILSDDFFKPSWSCFDNEVFINSQYKCDWAEQVDMGIANQCRMHTLKAKKLYFRVFRANPVREKDGTWTRDVGAAELSVDLQENHNWRSFFKHARTM